MSPRMTAMPARLGPRWSDDADAHPSASSHAAPAEVERADRSSPAEADGFDAGLASIRPRLVRLIAARLRSHADAEDVVQEALLRAWRYRDRYDPQRPLAGWLYRIALRAEADHHRRRRAPSAPADPAFHADPARGPLGVAIAAEQAERLWRTAGEALTVDQYTAVWLAYVEQLTPREIGRATGRRAGTVRVTLHRARARLADALTPDTPHERDHAPTGSAPS